MTPFSKEESEAQRVYVTCPGRLSGSVRETQPPEPVSFPPQAAVLDQALLSPSTLGLHQLFPSSPMSPSVLFSLPWKPGSLQFIPLSSSLSSWVSALSGPWRLSSFPPLSLGRGSVRGPTFHIHCRARGGPGEKLFLHSHPGILEACVRRGTQTHVHTNTCARTHVGVRATHIHTHAVSYEYPYTDCAFPVSTHTHIPALQRPGGPGPPLPHGAPGPCVCYGNKALPYPPQSGRAEFLVASLQILEIIIFKEMQGTSGWVGGQGEGCLVACG